MKMVFGFLFSLFIFGLYAYKREKLWWLGCLVSAIGALIFLGQFIDNLGG